MPMFKALIALTALIGAPGGPQPDKIAIEPPAAPRLSADAVVGKVQAFYVGTQSLKAKFRQEYTNTTFGKTSTSDGVLWIKKPGKMRWDYHKRRKLQKSFISDGVLLWAVEHDNKQVFKKNLGDDVLPVAITFLY